ncbi:phytoene/squalene synthase family protein [Paenochrobactrum sp. BZR 588]|uniref:phytoene/squalene synthase family protein n=1 Tax=unclassified Paenochrobactrum TaxID=2639760 RepID=UPI003852203C
MQDNELYCLDLVRQADKDRYLSLLYAPEEKRGALAALYAFNVEIARIRDVAKDALPGEVRLQWWRDLINGAGHGETESHPVAAALMAAIKRYSLPIHVFDAYCEARIFDLYNDPMPARHDLEGYCGETASVLIQMAALILDADRAPQFSEAAGHAGVAQSITGLLRLMPLHRARSQIYMPADILQAVGLNAETYLGSEQQQELTNLVSAIIALADEHYVAYKKASRSMPATLKPAFLPVCLVPVYLRALSRNAASVPTQISDISPLRRQWTMMKAALLG